MSHAGATGPVHFVYLGGEFTWQHGRAMRTARVHGSEIWLHAAAPVPRPVSADVPECRVVPLDLPDWLRHHPIRLANVKDLFAWRILHAHGGLYLDLDTISLRPAWDLLGDRGVCVSREYPDDSTHPHPHNSAAVVARAAAPALKWLAAETDAMLRGGEATWGAVGPHLLTVAVERFPDEFAVAPYRALNGWSYHDIGDYYADPRDPGEPVRVIHLYSSDHLDEFHADRWTP